MLIEGDGGWGAIGTACRLVEGRHFPFISVVPNVLELHQSRRRAISRPHVEHSTCRTSSTPTSPPMVLSMGIVLTPLNRSVSARSFKCQIDMARLSENLIARNIDLLEKRQGDHVFLNLVNLLVQATNLRE